MSQDDSGHELRQRTRADDDYVRIPNPFTMAGRFFRHYGASLAATVVVLPPLAALITLITYLAVMDPIAPMHNNALLIGIGLSVALWLLLAPVVQPMVAI